MEQRFERAVDILYLEELGLSISLYIKWMDLMFSQESRDAYL